MKALQKSERTPEFDAFVRRYTEALRRYFKKRILEEADIDDLVQEVFLRLAQRGLSDIEHVESYMFQTAANVLKDRFRHRTAHRLNAQDVLDENVAEDTAFSPERVLLGQEALREVVDGFKSLPKRFQDIIALSRIEGLKNPVIARRLGLSLSSVEKGKVKALALLYERVKDKL